MREERAYLSDDELEKLIAGVEREDIRRAPEYLEQMIQKKAERISTGGFVENVPIRHAFAKKMEMTALPVKKWGQFAVYCAKIVTAAAAAIALVIAMPKLQWQSAEYFRPKQQTQKSVTTSINEITDDFCVQIFEKTNKLLFQREEH